MGLTFRNRLYIWGLQMNENNVQESSQEQIPLMQRVLDNPFLLLVLGIAVPAEFYIIWGIIEKTQIPIPA